MLATTSGTAMWLPCAALPIQHRRDEGRHRYAGILQTAGDLVHLVELHAGEIAAVRLIPAKRNVL
jgi:hypothetical protein